MDPTPASLEHIAATSRRFAQRLLTIGGNRLELLMVEVQEQRERLLFAILLALGVATFGLLAGMAFTAALVVWLWASHPEAVLLTLAVLYSAGAVALYLRLAGLLRDWKSFTATLEQLRKDRVTLEKDLS